MVPKMVIEILVLLISVIVFPVPSVKGKLCEKEWI